MSSREVNSFLNNLIFNVESEEIKTKEELLCLVSKGVEDESSEIKYVRAELVEYLRDCSDTKESMLYYLSSY